MRPLFYSFSLTLVLAVSHLSVLSVSDAAAQDMSMKACGEKWQAAKAANATKGATWTTFLAECRAAGATAASPPAPVAAAPAPTATPAPAPAQAPTASVKTASQPVFPGAVSAKFAELRPSQARQKTCSEQYQANKASDANGGMRWLEKGGGYWSLCNKKLKGV
jgi:hypothetical protein